MYCITFTNSACFTLNRISTATSFFCKEATWRCVIFTNKLWFLRKTCITKYYMHGVFHNLMFGTNCKQTFFFFFTVFVIVIGNKLVGQLKKIVLLFKHIVPTLHSLLHSIPDSTMGEHRHCLNLIPWHGYCLQNTLPLILSATVYFSPVTFCMNKVPLLRLYFRFPDQLLICRGLFSRFCFSFHYYLFCFVISVFLINVLDFVEWCCFLRCVIYI